MQVASDWPVGIVLTESLLVTVELGHLLPTIDYRGFGVFPLQYSLLVSIPKDISLRLLKYEYCWVVKLRNTSEAVLRPQHTSSQLC